LKICALFWLAGEQFHVVIHLSVHDSNSCDVITPFKVAAAIERRSHASVEASKQESSPPQESLESSSTQVAINVEKPEVAHSSNDKSSLKGKWFNTTHGGNLVATTEWLSPDRSEVQSEGHKRRSLMVLESFKKSHFHVKIRKEGKGRVPKGLGQQSEQLNPNGEEGSDGELESFGCQPVVMEHSEFEPATGGGIARAATACWSLENGDAVVGFLSSLSPFGVLFLLLPIYSLVRWLLGPCLNAACRFPSKGITYMREPQSGTDINPRH
jgi:hypothetical protein